MERIWLLALPLSGCLSAGALERSAMQHEQNAEVLRELGQGEAAAREAQQAVSEHEAARRIAEDRNPYWQSEVLME